ncbi:MAG: transcription antitermination factor NusB, partial [Cytophagales bacterium]|nr:transcription antitermination factor NusB [Cytophagales bacterium]
TRRFAKKFFSMLNRRLLRIKALKYLYAFKTAQAADLDLTKDSISQFFTNDIFAEFPEDENKLKQFKEQTLAAFGRKIEEKRPFPATLPEEVRKQAEEAESSYTNKISADRQYFLKLLTQKTESIQEEYFNVLWLMLRVAEAADEEVPEGHRKLTENKIIASLLESAPLKMAFTRSTTNIPGNLIRDIYRNNVKKDKQYLAYITSEEVNQVSELEMATYLLKEIVLKNVSTDVFFEDSDLEWPENRKIIKDMVADTLKEWEEGKDIRLMQLTKDWESDKVFMQKLFTETALHFDEYMELVSAQLKNWDTERLALMDLVILVTGLSEMIHFTSIPVKVTINEYIDISKSYSTPKSKQFINGILDKLSIELKNNGTIKKSGKGLIDN